MKLVHLVGFITKKFVTMNDHMNVNKEPCDLDIIYKNISGEMVKKAASFSCRCKNYFFVFNTLHLAGRNYTYLLKHSIAT